jgi:hypothetical protein
VGQAKAWQDFAVRCERHRIASKALVESRRAAGKRLVGYGASARSSTLLNFCGLGATHLDCVADRAPLKHGTFTPGTDIPIVSPADAFAARPDAVLLLAWNFRDEILAQIVAEHGWHGEVLIPLPGDPAVVTIQ